jgi:hypothetical protein
VYIRAATKVWYQVSAKGSLVVREEQVELRNCVLTFYEKRSEEGVGLKMAQPLTVEPAGQRKHKKGAEQEVTAELPVEKIKELKPPLEETIKAKKKPAPQ